MLTHMRPDRDEEGTILTNGLNHRAESSIMDKTTAYEKLIDHHYGS